MNQKQTVMKSYFKAMLISDPSFSPLVNFLVLNFTGSSGHVFSPLLESACVVQTQSDYPFLKCKRGPARMMTR